MIGRSWWIVGLLASALAAEPAPGALDPAHARATAAGAAYQDALTRYSAGMAPLEEVYVWSTRLFDAQHDVGDPGAGAAQVARMKALADLVHGRVQAGAATQSDELATAYYTADAAYHSR